MSIEHHWLEWKNQESGIECYLCPLRLREHAGIDLIATLSVSVLYLGRDQRFRGNSVLILTAHETQLEGLTQDLYVAYIRDLRLSMRALREAFLPDHMNVALLGNTCPHLHWSIVPRYRSDSRWGKPIWEDTTLQEMNHRPVTLTEAQYVETIALIRNRIDLLKQNQPFL